MSPANLGAGQDWKQNSSPTFCRAGCCKGSVSAGNESRRTTSAWLWVKNKIKFWWSLRKVRYTNEVGHGPSCVFEQVISVGVNCRWKTEVLGNRRWAKWQQQELCCHWKAGAGGSWHHLPALAALLGQQQLPWDAAEGLILPRGRGVGVPWARALGLFGLLEEWACSEGLGTVTWTNGELCSAWCCALTSCWSLVESRNWACPSSAVSCSPWLLRLR